MSLTAGIHTRLLFLQCLAAWILIWSVVLLKHVYCCFPYFLKPNCSMTTPGNGVGLFGLLMRLMLSSFLILCCCSVESNQHIRGVSSRPSVCRSCFIAAHAPQSEPNAMKCIHMWMHRAMNVHMLQNCCMWCRGLFVCLLNFLFCFFLFKLKFQNIFVYN